MAKGASGITKPLTYHGAAQLDIACLHNASEQGSEPLDLSCLNSQPDEARASGQPIICILCDGMWATWPA